MGSSTTSDMFSNAKPALKNPKFKYWESNLVRGQSTVETPGNIESRFWDKQEKKEDKIEKIKQEHLKNLEQEKKDDGEDKKV